MYGRRERTRPEQPVAEWEKQTNRPKKKYESETTDGGGGEGIAD